MFDLSYDWWDGYDVRDDVDAGWWQMIEEQDREHASEYGDD